MGLEQSGDAANLEGAVDRVASDTQEMNPVALATVRVLDAAGEAVGAGFVVGPRQVATCAHVVAAVLGGDPGSPQPLAGTVRVDLPLLPVAHASDAVVATWRAIDPATGVGDIAILELADPPPGARTPPLYRPDRLWGHRFRVLGFPPGMQDGVWAAGELRDRQGTRWLQLQGDPGGQPVVGGFSGAPVWDEEVEAVVGMTVASDGSSGGTAYLVPIEDVFDVDPRLMPNPYRGLEAFGEEHADVFHGRDDEVDRLAAVLDRQPLVAVVGRSGTGKSSLVRAGLLPRLRRGGVRIVDLRAQPADGTPGVAVDQLLEAAAGEGGGERAGPGVVVFVDQFEELVGVEAVGAGDGRTPAQELLRRLVELVEVDDGAGSRPSVRVVLTLRWEAMNELLTGEVVETFDHGMFSLTPMSRDQLRQAVVGPTARAPGLRFADGLVERILDDAVAEPGQLPLVESLLTQLWESRQGGTVEASAYDRAGGVKGAVARHAEQVVGELSEAEATRLPRLLTALARPDEAGGFVRRAVLLDVLSAEDRQLVERLAHRRLLVVGQAGQGTDGRHTVELAHQALIDHWPRLQGWLEADRELLLWHHEADRRRQAWEQAGRDDGGLLRGVALVQAEDWLRRRPADVAAAVRGYVEASRRHARGEARRRRAVVATVATVAALALLLGSLFVYQRRVTGREEAESDSRALAALSADTVATDPAWSIMLALVAYERSPTPEAENALFGHYVAFRSTETVLSGARGDILEVDASRDGGVVAARTQAGTVVVWLRAPGRPVETVHLPGGRVVAMEVDADGRRILLQSLRGHEVYDIEERSVTWTVPVPGDDVVSMALGPDGRVALRTGATPGTGDSSLEVWEAGDDGEAVRIGRFVPEPIGALSSIVGFGPSPDTLIVGQPGAGEDEPSTIVAWNVRTGAVTPLPDPGGAGGKAFAADGALVTCAGADSPLGESSLVRYDLRDGSTVSHPLPPGELCGLGPYVDAAGELALTDGSFAVDLRDGAVHGQTRPTVESAAIFGPVVTDGDRRFSVRSDGNAVFVTELYTGDQALPAERVRSFDGVDTGGTLLPRFREAQLLPDGQHVLTVSEDSTELTVLPADGRGEAVARATRSSPALAPIVGGPRVGPAGTLLADRVSPTKIQVRRLPDLDLVSEVTTDPVADADVTGELSTGGMFWDGDRLLTYDGPLVQWWDPTTGRLDGGLDAGDTGLVDDGDVAEMTIAPYADPGQVALSVLGDPEIHVLDRDSGREVDTIRAGDDVIALQFQSDSPYFALLRQGSLFEMWDRTEGRRVLGPLRSLGDSNPEAGDIIVQFLDRKGSFLLGDQNQLRWYQAGSATPVRRLDLGVDRVPMWASDDGTTILHLDHRIDAVVMPALHLDPEEWRTTLCDAIDDRPLAPEERGLLASVVSRSPCG